LYLSRLREYYADRHGASIVEDGARKLSEGLVKIVHSAERIRRHRPETNSLASFKALFIADPDSASRDLMEMTQMSSLASDQALVERYLRKKITMADKIAEIFSTHPNMVKRLKALQELT